MNAPSPGSPFLENLRADMKARGLDALLVRTTDRYLNEYVPPWSATREWLTGFTGSMGDAVVTLDRAFLLVDGRYHAQAEQEVTADWSVVKLTLAEPIFSGLVRLVTGLAADGKVRHVGMEADRSTVHEVETLQRALDRTPAKVVLLNPSPLDALMGTQVRTSQQLRVLDEGRVGRTSAQKVAAVQEVLQAAKVDLLVVQKLDELAYLTNLRADDLPFQATFTGMGAVGRQGAVLCLHGRTLPPHLQTARPDFQCVEEPHFSDALKRAAGTGRVAAVDGGVTTHAVKQMLEAAGFTIVALPSPLVEMKARKTPQEMACMQEAFAKADRVVSQCVRWLNRKVTQRESVTEADFALQVERAFKKSGATGLSFKVISAAGANGAIIHYSTPDKTRRIVEGELMLLDTGAYYAEGYATDLTRTFLVGGPKVKANAEQKRLFTLVLKSAIAGMTAVFPETAPGIALDTITRKPLWDQGLTYNHGTGHGVGINVHEAPPSINMRSTAPVLPGTVFSIEPGVYVQGWGGVRIENLCTADPLPNQPGWLRVRPLTFSPLDARLIDARLLTPAEKMFVRDFQLKARQTTAA